MKPSVAMTVQCHNCGRWPQLLVHFVGVAEWPLRLRCPHCQKNGVTVYCEMLPAGTPHIMNNCYCERIQKLEAAGVTNIGQKMANGWSVKSLEETLAAK